MIRAREAFGIIHSGEENTAFTEIADRCRIRRCGTEGHGWFMDVTVLVAERKTVVRARIRELP